MTDGLSSEIHQFADDTNIVKISSNPVTAIQAINLDLQVLSQLAEQWRVSFNPTKTNYIIVSLKK